MTVPPVPPVPPASPGAPGAAPKQRPAVVTAACALMFGVAALGVLSVILALSLLGPVLDAVEKERLEPPLDTVAPQIVTWSFGITIALSLMVAASLAVLGLFNLRGANGARVTTWVLVAVFLLCGVCGLLGQGVSGMLPADGGDPNSERMVSAMESATPAWYNTVSLGITAVNVLAYIAIVVLLALPASNEFFRKAVPQWEPPAEYVGPPPGAAPGGSWDAPSQGGAPESRQQPPADPDRPPEGGPGQPPRES